MIPTSADRVLNWLGVLAAMVYLATFLSLSYALYAATRGASFIDSAVLAYPRALAACVLLFICCVSIEAVKAAHKKVRGEDKAVAVHSFVHR
jgi:hypothetical protein